MTFCRSEQRHPATSTCDCFRSEQFCQRAKDMNAVMWILTAPQLLSLLQYFVRFFTGTVNDKLLGAGPPGVHGNGQQPRLREKEIFERYFIGPTLYFAVSLPLTVLIILWVWTRGVLVFQLNMSTTPLVVALNPNTYVPFQRKTYNQPYTSLKSLKNGQLTEGWQSGLPIEIFARMMIHTHNVHLQYFLQIAVMDVADSWSGRMTSEAAVSTSPAISSTPVKRDYYFLRSFVAGGRIWHISSYHQFQFCDDSHKGTQFQASVCLQDCFPLPKKPFLICFTPLLSFVTYKLMSVHV